MSSSSSSSSDCKECCRERSPLELWDFSESFVERHYIHYMTNLNTYYFLCNKHGKELPFKSRLVIKSNPPPEPFLNKALIAYGYAPRYGKSYNTKRIFDIELKAWRYDTPSYMSGPECSLRVEPVQRFGGVDLVSRDFFSRLAMDRFYNIVRGSVFDVAALSPEALTPSVTRYMRRQVLELCSKSATFSAFVCNFAVRNCTDKAVFPECVVPAKPQPNYKQQLRR